MNIRDYYEKKKDLEYLITYNERIHCPRVAAKWRRELNRLEEKYEHETSDDNKRLCAES